MKDQYDQDDKKTIPSPEVLAAKIVSRWKSGASLAQHPQYDPVDHFILITMIFYMLKIRRE
jgi:hypothetical protein